MTPQAQFTIVAPISAGREAALRALLASMNTTPGLCDPNNALLPFAQFPQLHVARFFVLDDPTLDGSTAYGLPRPELPIYLVLLGDCDGSADALLQEFAARANNGLRRIFEHCAGFNPQTNLLSWLRANDQPIAATYVNWVGRTVTQVREEQALQRALTAQLARLQGNVLGQRQQAADVQALHRQLAEYTRNEIADGRLTLTPPAATPYRWSLRNLVHAIAWPLVAVLAAPLLLIASPWLIYTLRTKEKYDPELASPPPLAVIQQLQAREDHDVTNQFSAVGTVKPGLFRRWAVTILLSGLNYACRHIYTRGHLTRVQTIHFARWAFLDNKTRLIFASNYDGSLESYMDDFINKVGWGLNLVFSNGIGYPRTDWLVMNGARSEQRFKSYLRGHEVPTDVWYKAYPGMTAVDLARNTRIRDGLERGAMNNADTIAWLRLL